jgi:hypothetical protein
VGKRTGLITTLGVLLMVLLAGLYSCQKTESPLGVYAPYGLDRPTYTPTPSSGSIQVYVQDTGTAIQGVSIILVDPSGNTLGPELTQPVVGFASFSPPNLISGTWLAEVLTQPVSYVVTSASPVTIHHYYYSSIQSFPVTGSGFYPVTFSKGTNTVSVTPASILYSLTYPANLPMTITYDTTGNLNVPVSVNFPTLPPGISAAPSTFIMGEGTTQQPVTIDKSVCYSGEIPIQMTCYDFVGFGVQANAVTLEKSYPVSIIMYGGFYGSPTNKMVYTLYTTNDCGIVWSYEIINTHLNVIMQTGTVSNGGSVTFAADPSTVYDDFQITSPIGTYLGGEYEGVAPVTFEDSSL